MSATKHTPGPWATRRSLDGSGDVGITAPGVLNVIAECFADMRRPGEFATDEASANARLIAAAPEMLEALDRIADLSRALRQGGPDPMDLQGLSDALNEAVDLASALATKATGGQS